MLESWANRRKNERLVAEVVGDRKGQISRNKVEGPVQNGSCHLTSGRTTNRLLTDITTLSVAEFHDRSYDRSLGATIDRMIDRLWLPLVVRFPTI